MNIDMNEDDYGYRYPEGITTADAAFEAVAPDLNRLFSYCAEAMFAIMADPDSISQTERHDMNLESESTEELLFLFLSELIYLKDTEGVIFSRFEVSVTGEFKLKAAVYGQKISELASGPDIDIKAVTYHRFRIEQVEAGFRATVVVDL
jgi:SHS2 domain-containing protein